MLAVVYSINLDLNDEISTFLISSHSMAIVKQGTCGHSYSVLFHKCSLGLISSQHLYMVTCGVEMLQKIARVQVSVNHPNNSCMVVVEKH